MGKNKFRLSDIMPNAWFYKLKDMNPKPPLAPPPPPFIPKRASYYIPSPKNTDIAPPPHLRPILTKPLEKDVTVKKTPRRVRMRRVMTSKRRRGLGESVAVVKTSDDPRRDFKESMVEMIVVNGLERKQDLEELLACYLSLNSEEYHVLIVKVFQEIWFDRCNC